MSKALLSLACLLGTISVVSAAEPVQGYHVELVIHQGPKKADGSSILSHPSLCLAEGQPGLFTSASRCGCGGRRPATSACAPRERFDRARTAWSCG